MVCKCSGSASRRVERPALACVLFNYAEPRIVVPRVDLHADSGSERGFVIAVTSSSYRVSIRSEPPQKGQVSQTWVRDVVRRALGGEEAPEGGRVEVLLAGDETVAELNAAFLGAAGTTDVLSFPANDADYGDDEPDDDAWPSGTDPGAKDDIGQLVISVPQAARQAEASGLALAEEVAHLLVHGTLHLLGHDHELMDDEAAMRAREDALLMKIIGRPVHGTEPMASSHATDAGAGHGRQTDAEIISGTSL